jgi:hypothetical protein
MLYRGLVVTMATWIDLVAAGSSNLAPPSVMLAPNKNPSRKIVKTPIPYVNSQEKKTNESIKLKWDTRGNVPVTHLPKINAFIR